MSRNRSRSPSSRLPSSDKRPDLGCHDSFRKPKAGIFVGQNRPFEVISPLPKVASIPRIRRFFKEATSGNIDSLCL
jgi:hypothetical protein